MREHQIVVNLKAQQFEQLQQLARERGFKSVSAYIKQKVLELAMGLDSGADGTGGSEAGIEQLSMAAAPVLGDLDRIHNELKSFLDELSGPTELPNSAFTSSTATAGSGSAPEVFRGFSSSGSAFSSSANSGSSSNSASGTSERDFGVAAPDEDFDWATSGGSGYSTAAYSDGLTPSGSASGNNVTSAASSFDIGTGASSFQEDSDASTLPQVLPSNNLGGFGYGLGKYSSFGGAGTSARFSTPFNAGDRLSGYRDIMDDMEELADRAFAISPRLGALDESVEDEPAEDRGRRKRVEHVEPELKQSELDQSELVEPELDAQGAAELEASAYEDSADDYDSGYDYAEEELKLDLELGVIAAAPPQTSFVEPIALDKLLTPEQLEAEEVQEKLIAKEGKKAQAEAKMRADLADIAPVTDFSPAAASELAQPAVAKSEETKSEQTKSEETKQPETIQEATTQEENTPEEPKVEVKPLLRRRSNKLFDDPMLPPPDEIDESVERKPTFVPPPAPLPPRVSQTNIPAMSAEEAAAIELEAARAAAAAIEDNLLSELLDGNLAHQRDHSAPNPFAVSLSFELEATAVATNDVAGPVGILADQLASMEEQTPLGQVAMAAEAALHEASAVADADSTNTSGSTSTSTTASSESSSSGSGGTSAPADASSTDSGEESLNPTTFSGTPPPKRRRT
ncbi:hypothetical protein BH11CYA1_BH11CYA1_07030 [soil metagenome]